MRTMPTIIDANPDSSDPTSPLPRGSEPVPVIPAADFNARLHAAVGDLSDAERAEVDRMSRHNWTLRVIVDAICEGRGVEAPTTV